MYRNPFATVVVVGVPGVGKSTVLSIASRVLGERGVRVLVVNYGDFMFEELRERGLVSSRDELRRLPLRTQYEHQAAVAKRILRYAEERLGGAGAAVLFIDTHLWIRTRAGYWPGLPLHVVQELRPDLIVLIEADPREILARQARDATRYRQDYADPRVLEELQELNRREALVVATLSGAAVRTVVNREGEAEKAARELVEAVTALYT